VRSWKHFWHRFDWIFENRKVTGPLFAVLAVLCMLSALFAEPIASLQLISLPYKLIDDSPAEAIQKTIIGFWTLFPPLWFPLEYWWAEATERPDLTRLRLGQEFAEKIWAGVVAFLAVILFAGS